MSRPLDFTFCIISLLTACTSKSGTEFARSATALDPAVHDSAGVKIYEHSADALERASLFTIDSVPLYRYAGSIEDTARDVSSLTDFNFVSDGRLVAFDQGRGALVVLGPDGTIHRFGRHGAGPLELGDYPDIVVTQRDTILLSDRANNRFVLASPDSGLLRSITLAGVEGLSSYNVLGQAGNGLLLLSQARFEFKPGELSGVVRPGFAYATWRPDGPPPVERFRYPFRLMETGTVDLGNGKSGQSLRTLALTDSPVVLADGNGFVATPATKWQIEWRDTTGALRSIIRMPWRRQVVDRVMWQRYVTFVSKRLIDARPGRDADSTRRALEERGHADSLPAIDALGLSPNGTRWMIDAAAPGDSAWALTALDRVGRILGRYRSDSGPRPWAYGDGELLFRTEDDNGIATLTVRRVRFGG